MQKFKNVHREDPEKNVSETDRQADRLTDRQTDEQNYKYSKNNSFNLLNSSNHL